MKAIIIYKGKYGATAQYAHWLQEELQIPLRSANDLTKEEWKGCDLLLIGTSVYIGKLQITPWLKDNLPLLMNKKIFLFLVAATPPNEEEKLRAYIESGVPGEIKQNCRIYYLPGKMIMRELSWKDRFMLKIGARLAKDPEDRKNMLTDFNGVKKENIAEMIAAVKKSFNIAKEASLSA